jgi:hypothetical protein
MRVQARQLERIPTLEEIDLEIRRMSLYPLATKPPANLQSGGPYCKKNRNDDGEPRWFPVIIGTQ